MKAAYDRNAKPHLYDVGQLVWFNVRNLGLRHPARRHKLMPKYIGPVKVLEVIGINAVRLELPDSLKIHPTVSVTLVKPFLPRPGVDAPPVIINGVEEWEVEAVVEHHVVLSRRKGGRHFAEFKVRWKGDFEDSWHEFSDFEHSLDTLERYLMTVCTKAARLQIYKALQPAEIARLSRALQNEQRASAKA
jgi:hypothetical protein